MNRLQLMGQLYNQDIVLVSLIHGDHQHGKPGKVREFHIDQGILVCLWCAAGCDSHKINLTQVQLSKVDMHKMD